MTHTPEVEITNIPPLQPGEASLLDMHSVLNALNVLVGELMAIGNALDGNLEFFHESLDLCARIRDGLTDPGLALQHALLAPAHEKAVLDEVGTALAARPEIAARPDIQASVENLHSIFRIIAVRCQETLARLRYPDRWADLELQSLYAELRDVLDAIARNSKGRYRITYNLADQQPTDYYVDFFAESLNGRSISLPLVVRDVLRDLIANARKYTAPGGIINVGLHETADEVRLVVQDNGRGIPEEEIPQVVQYGCRGSNTTDVRTMGGGIGLTKAFLTTKQFGGRFWIKSKVGVGTRVTIAIPRPPE